MSRLSAALLVTLFLLLSLLSSSSAGDAICVAPKPLAIDAYEAHGPFPTQPQLYAVQSWFARRPPSTLFTPTLPERYAETMENKFGPHIYLKDDRGHLWHAESRPFDGGGQGDVRRAWNLTATLERGEKESPTYIMKDVRISYSQEVSKGSFLNEIDALVALGRLVGNDAVIVDVSVDEGRTRKKFTGSLPKLPTGELRPRYPDSTKAYFLQTFVRGTPIEKFKTPIPRWAVAVLRDRLYEKVRIVHEAGWMHADLAPRNILVEVICDGENKLKDFDVNIVDFGTALPIKNPFHKPDYDWRDAEESVGYVEGYFTTRESGDL